MKGIGVIYGTEGVRLFDRDYPQIKKQATDIDKVLIKVKEVGVSTNDKRMVGGEVFDGSMVGLPFVIGQEMVGQVVDIGAEVKDFKIGDIVVPTVLRGCGSCFQCARGNSDICLSGLYKERGIHGAEGYMAEYVVERLGNIVLIPEQLENVAVLLTPLSLAEKALAATISIGHRMDHPYPFPDHAYHHEDWGIGKKGMVVGSTTVALMATFLLRKNMVDTYVVSDHQANSSIASIVKEVGATHIERGNNIVKTIKEIGRFDLVIEATGSGNFEPWLVDLMDYGSVMALTTRPSKGIGAKVNINDFLRERMMHSQILFDAIGSNLSHYKRGINSLGYFRDNYANALSRVVDNYVSFSDFEEAFTRDARDSLKTILSFK